MNREAALKIALGIVGVIFLLLGYPMFAFMREEPALAMMMSLYVTLGVFLLLALRRPAQHRSLILFTAWSSIVHGVFMGAQVVLLHVVARGELIGVAVLFLIGITLIALAPPRIA